MSDLSVKDVRALAEARFWRRHTWKLVISGIAVVVLAIVGVVIASRYDFVESNTLIIGGQTVTLEYEGVNNIYLLAMVPLVVWVVFLCVLAWKQARFRDKFLQKWVDEKELPDDLSS